MSGAPAPRPSWVAAALEAASKLQIEAPDIPMVAGNVAPVLPTPAATIIGGLWRGAQILSA